MSVGVASVITVRSGLFHRLLGQAPADQVILDDQVLVVRDATTTPYALAEVRSLHSWAGLVGRRLALTLENGQRVALAAGVSHHAAEQFATAFLERHAMDRTGRHRRISEAMPKLQLAAAALHGLISGEQYLSRSRLHHWRQEHGTGLPHDIAAQDLDLSASMRKTLAKLRWACQDPAALANAYNVRYVGQQLAKFAGFFDKVEAQPLTDRQRLAVVRDEDRNLVVAGAGTGKTSVVVARVGYLLQTGHAESDDVLVLAFARKAREELQQRLQDRIGRELEVRTFHSLGLTILGKAHGRKPSLSKAAEDEREMDRRLGRYLDELLRDPRTTRRLIHFFAYHLRPSPPVSQFKTADEHYRHLRAHGVRTLRGELVKSQQEVELANWMTLNGIAYEYEARYRAAETADATHRAYVPDFYLPEHDIYIEHFGIDRNGHTAPYISAAAYSEQMQWKRMLHTQHGTTLIETYSYQFTEATVFDDLKSTLEAHGVQLRPISADELHMLLVQSNELRPLVTLLKTFLHLYKSTDTTIKALLERAAVSTETTRAEAFIAVFECVLQRYQTDLQTEDAIDFDDMIREATKAVQAGEFRSPFRHLIVDEFQDIAAGRANLIRALLDQVPDSRLLVVGDDWQSIYRFTGSDVGLMTRFESHFGPTARTDLDVAFRYPTNLLEPSAHFITRNPEQLSKQLIARTAGEGKAIRVRHKRQEERQEVLRSVLEEISNDLSGGRGTVLILGRYRHTIEGLPGPLTREFPQVSIEARTVHAAKGLEADCVVVLDVNCGRLGFPSEVADDPLLELVLTQSRGFAHAEERRLFYVALTRARRNTYLICDEGSPSPFITELAEPCYEMYVQIETTGYATASCEVCGGRLVRRSGPHGLFWGCSNFPYCRAKGTPCGFCGGTLIRQGRRFHCNRAGCAYDAEICPQCGTGALHIKVGRYGHFWGCSAWPGCEYAHSEAKNLSGRA